ncbi:MAG TPA: CHAT domain-containing protein [Streptosporangiaceae bacterium]|jgi:tetratricopeptide (TPR) repeat protein
MAGGPRPGSGSAHGVLDLLPLTGARPGEALAKARAVLATDPAPFAASVAHQTIGTVLRDFGDLDGATAELRAAARLARAAHATDREADVLATLGVALVYRGHSERGLAALDSSLALVTGPAAARVLVRRGIALWVLGRHREALDDVTRAIRILRPAGDTIWEARALTTRALVHLAFGSAHRAELDLGRADRLFATTSQELEVAYTWHNRGLVAFRSGDLPAALSCLDEAARRYTLLAIQKPDLAIDRCAVLLAAGLPADALRETDAAADRFPRRGGQATKKAELLLSAAEAALAAGEPGLAAARAQAALPMFTAQGRHWWGAHAGLLLLQARCASRPPSARLLRQAAQVAADLDLLGSSEAAQARLLAGRLARALGQPAEADAHLTAAARDRHRRVTALARAQGWLAEALRADAAGDRRRLLAACGRGLAILDEHQVTLGASELRAQATAHGAELAALAQRAALGTGRPRLMLSWSERWRATAHAVPAARPADDGDLQADLTALRDVTSRLARARASGDPAGHFRREQLRLEASVRARVLRSRHDGRGGEGGWGGGWGFTTEQLLRGLGRATLVQIVAIDGDLHILVCGAGRVRHVRGGRADEAATEVGFARFGLHRLAHGRGAGPGGTALATLEASGRRLEAILLGPAARLLGSGPVVVVPPGRLHAVPWALLPALRDRAVSVAPSARAWLQAQAVQPPDLVAPVFVQGPGLGTGTEIPALAAEYPDATVLGSGTATARRVLGALDGAGLAHIAAHGSFRADSPLFSSLLLDDGPLTVYDLERLRRAPYRVIFSSCDSGVLAPTGADELLGLAHCLAPLGTAGIVASVVPVNDQATATLMTALHKHLRGGAGLAEALRLARDGAADEPVQAATAWSFLALGAA